MPAICPHPPREHNTHVELAELWVERKQNYIHRQVKEHYFFSVLSIAQHVQTPLSEGLPTMLKEGWMLLRVNFMSDDLESFLGHQGSVHHSCQHLWKPRGCRGACKALIIFSVYFRLSRWEVKLLFLITPYSTIQPLEKSAGNLSIWQQPTN